MAKAMVAGGAVVLALGLGLGAVHAPVGARGGGAVPAVPAVGSGPAVDSGPAVHPGHGVTRATAGPGAPAGAPVPGADEGPSPRSVLPPLDPPLVVARPFEPPERRWTRGHRGADLSARPGQAVLAPETGIVSFAGTVVDRGVVTVTHAGGLRSSLEPVDPSVRRGERVRRGEVVGSVAAAPGHCVPSTCLHWGLRRGETYLDPLRWVLDGGPVVLLPSG